MERRKIQWLGHVKRIGANRKNDKGKELEYRKTECGHKSIPERTG